MINRILIIALTIVLVSCGELEEELLFEQLKVSELVQKESDIAKVYDGYEHGALAKSLYNGDDAPLRKSVLTLRKLKSGLPLKTKYYFNPQDSLVKFVLYIIYVG